LDDLQLRFVRFLGKSGWIKRHSLYLYYMAQTLNLNVQRWVYERGNYQIVIDNAWSLSPLYTQERITVNGERVRDCIPVVQSIIFWRTVFEDTILDSTGELELKVQWKSGLMTCKSRLLIEGEKQDWTDYFEKKWTGPRGEWPEQNYYER